MIKIVIFDWKRTLYDPDASKLIKGTIELLNFLESKKIPMILIGKGGDDMQQEVDRLRVGRYFQNIVFAQGEKDPKVFADYISKDKPKNTAG